MEVIKSEYVLPKTKVQNNTLDIVETLTKNIDIDTLQKRDILHIDPNVLQDNELIKRGIGIQELLELTGMYNTNNLEEIAITKIDNSQKKIIEVSIFGKYFLIQRHIDITNNCIYNKEIDTRRDEELSGIKIFINQVQKARELNFGKIYCNSTGDFNGREKKGASIGYYIRPMVGYFNDLENENTTKKNEINKIIQNGSSDIKKCNNLNEVLKLRDGFGKRIGLMYWKENGCGFKAVFDLSDNSESMNILKEYIFQKKQENPKKYNEIKTNKLFPI